MLQYKMSVLGFTTHKGTRQEETQRKPFTDHDVINTGV